MDHIEVIFLLELAAIQAESIGLVHGAYLHC